MHPKQHGRARQSGPSQQHQQQQHHPTKPTSKGARKEVYGFVGWMTSFVAFGSCLARAASFRAFVLLIFDCPRYFRRIFDVGHSAGFNPARNGHLLLSWSLVGGCDPNLRRHAGFVRRIHLLYYQLDEYSSSQFHLHHSRYELKLKHEHDSTWSIKHAF